MILLVALALFYLLIPLLLIYLCKVSTILKRIGAVVLAYAIGLVAGNTGLIPSPGAKFRAFLEIDPSLPKSAITQLIESGQLQQSDYLVNQVLVLQNIIMTIAIPIAIPLLLFSLDIRKWLKLAKGALLSLVLALVSLLIVVFAGYFMFRSHIDESSTVAGMLVGVYTGGTVNLAAIGDALNVSSNTYILTHTYDLVIGTVALLFLMTVAQRLFHTFLPKFRVVYKAENQMQLGNEDNDMENFDQLFYRKNFRDMVKAFGIAVFIFAIGGGLSLLFPKPNDSVVAILAITTLGLIASMIKSVNRLKNSFPLGMYFIIVFSLVISSLANLSNMIVNFEETMYLFFYVLFVVFGSIVITCRIIPYFQG